MTAQLENLVPRTGMNVPCHSFSLGGGKGSEGTPKKTKWRQREVSVLSESLFSTPRIMYHHHHPLCYFEPRGKKIKTTQRAAWCKGT